MISSRIHLTKIHERFFLLSLAYIAQEEVMKGRHRTKVQLCVNTSQSWVSFMQLNCEARVLNLSAGYIQFHLAVEVVLIVPNQNADDAVCS